MPILSMESACLGTVNAVDPVGSEVLGINLQCGGCCVQGRVPGELEHGLRDLGNFAL